MSDTCCSKNEKPAENNHIVQNMILYQPIIIVFILSLLAGFAVHMASSINLGDAVMAFFLMFLSFLKFLNLKGFIETFLKYDVLAKRVKFYGIAYPFIEFSLACLYFSGLFPLETNIIMLIVMSIGIIGIIGAMKSNDKLACACVGSGFKSPVGRVTLAENTAMGVMALMNLFILLT